MAEQSSVCVKTILFVSTIMTAAGVLMEWDQGGASTQGAKQSVVCLNGHLPHHPPWCDNDKQASTITTQRVMRTHPRATMSLQNVSLR
jgi:hypothetical protein